MARLIVLNGPPGIGKSTLARRYVADHPMALCAELDVLRRSLGNWQADIRRATERARLLTLSLARDHLAAGYDVVLPHYLGNPRFLAAAEDVADAAHATFLEFLLTDNRDEIVRRFAARTAAAATEADVQAGELIAALGGDDTLFAMCDRLLLLAAARPRIRLLRCPDGGEDTVYGELLAAIEQTG